MHCAGLSPARQPCAALCFGLPLLIGSISSTARAEASVTVHYDAPDGCGSERDVRTKFEAALGDASAVDGSLDASVKVDKQPDGLVLHFKARYRGVTSRRTLAVDDCEAATEAAAVLLLLTVDPLLAESLGMEAPESTATASPSPVEDTAPKEPLPKQPPPTAETDHAEQPPPTERVEDKAFTGFVGLSAVVSHGSTRELGLGPGFHAGAGLGVLETALSLYWLPEREDELSAVDGGTLRTSALAALVELHLRFERGQFVFGPLVSYGGVRVMAGTGGVTSPGADTTQWMVVHGGGFARFRLRPEWAVGLNAMGVFPLQRPTFSVDGLGVVHQPETVGVDISLSALWLWGSQSADGTATE